MSRIFKSTFSIALTLFFLFSTSLFALHLWSARPFQETKPKYIYFTQGTSLSELAGLLETQGVVDHGVFFHGWVRFFRDYSKFQAGTYKIHGAMSPQAIAEKISAGKVHRKVFLQVTIPEGFTLDKTISRLAAKKVGTRRQLKALSKDAAFLRSLGLKGMPSLEGFLYPATYSFYQKPTPRLVYSRMVKNFFKNVSKDLIKELKSKKLDLLEATVFASLIELETQIEDEKPKVAEVIWRRLKRREPLGIDASVIYGIKDFDGDLTWEHLADRKNPYNLRVFRGLPPGPIGSPSLSSFKAILNPTDRGYYYYVLIADGNNRHHFSKTLREHNRYVKKLLKASRSKK